MILYRQKAPAPSIMNNQNIRRMWDLPVKIRTTPCVGVDWMYFINRLLSLLHILSCHGSADNLISCVDVLESERFVTRMVGVGTIARLILAG